MSTSALRRSLDQALLDFAWSEWAQMGVLAAAPHRSRWAEDPEALIVLTLEVARDDPRLFDELLDWLVRNESLVSVRRLRSFAVDPQDTRLVDGALAWVGGHRPRARLRARAAQRTDDAVPLFTDSGFPTREPDPLFLTAGLLRPPVGPSGKSQAPDLRAPINFAFRLRQVLGLGARAEVVRLLLTTDAPSVNTADLAAGAGYARRNVSEAVGALQDAGVVSTVRSTSGQRYRLDRSAWSGLLGLDGVDGLPESLAWPQLLRALVRVRRWLRDVEGAELSEYMLASRTRDLLDEIVAPLSQANVAIPTHAGVDAAWPSLQETVAAAMTVLSVPATATAARGS